MVLPRIWAKLGATSDSLWIWSVLRPPKSPLREGTDLKKKRFASFLNQGCVHKGKQSETATIHDQSHGTNPACAKASEGRPR